MSCVCMFCRSLFVLLYFFFCPFCCLFFFHIRILIASLVSSNSSFLLNRQKMNEIFMSNEYDPTAAYDNGQAHLYYDYHKLNIIYGTFPLHLTCMQSSSNEYALLLVRILFSLLGRFFSFLLSTRLFYWRMSYKKHERLTLPELLGSSSVFICGQCCSSFKFLLYFYCVCLRFLSCANWCTFLNVSLDCPFLIAPSVFSKVYFLLYLLSFTYKIGNMSTWSVIPFPIHVVQHFQTVGISPIAVWFSRRPRQVFNNIIS